MNSKKYVVRETLGKDNDFVTLYSEHRHVRGYFVRLMAVRFWSTRIFSLFIHRAKRKTVRTDRFYFTKGSISTLCFPNTYNWKKKSSFLWNSSGFLLFILRSHRSTYFPPPKSQFRHLKLVKITFFEHYYVRNVKKTGFPLRKKVFTTRKHNTL